MTQQDKTPGGQAHASSSAENTKPRLGIALGSGSARGWAHIGVLRALNEMGIEPAIVAGTSAWALSIGKLDVLRMMDFAPTRGGFIAGSRLFDTFQSIARDALIEELPLPFTAVATDFGSGREIWLREGSLHDAVRASLSLPGLFTPFERGGRWLVDGGLVNPIPVSVCRALGADYVIAINLGGDLTDRNTQLTDPPSLFGDDPVALEEALSRLPVAIRERVEGPARFLLAPRLRGRNRAPGFFDVIAGAINIMQERVTRSRMAGDPPDILLEPRLESHRMLDFDHAKEAIHQGRLAVERMRGPLERLADLQP